MKSRLLNPTQIELIMTKKIKSKKKDPPKPQEQSQIREKQAPQSNENEYGGLPERDLKKNLGCG